MADQLASLAMGRARRQLLLDGAGIGLALLLAGRVRAEEPNPPVFGTARSQFIIVRPRKPLAPLRLQDLNGKAMVLAPKPGHVTLVNLWATWCAACKTDLPMLAKLDHMQLPRLDVWAVCTDQRDFRTIRRYAQEVAMPRLSFADPDASATDPANPDASTFVLTAMPITYLIGTGGLIEGYITGAPEWLSAPGQALLRYYLDQPA
ncbi:MULTISPECIES: TlpA family protein disulfide reductase [unclassified Bradyrhizobium]|uniref:TlpA family protein disulfide reductase n=1 Tax=unclassified Bradyrhizobium TaxID=2631580 RepID=UPI0028ECB7FC|nr:MULTISPECIES: redoxin family protein [unclassified Bradyrhizobium]